MRDVRARRIPSIMNGVTNGRVLLLEDDETLRELLADFFSESELEVRAARVFSGVLPLVAGWRPTLLLFDIGLPESDGLESLRRLRAFDPSLGEVPAVAMTAYRFKPTPEEIYAAGFDELLEKPFGIEALLTIIDVARGPATGRRVRDASHVDTRLFA